MNQAGSHFAANCIQCLLHDLLDTLKNTATGFDGLPVWYLRIGTQVFYKPLAILFNRSVSTSTVPTQ